MRYPLPNATFVAFTGTQVSAEDRDTRAVFGDYLHVYDMQEAQEDGATVPIYFESRLAKLGLKQDDLPHIDAEARWACTHAHHLRQTGLATRLAHGCFRSPEQPGSPVGWVCTHAHHAISEYHSKVARMKRSPVGYAA